MKFRELLFDIFLNELLELTSEFARSWPTTHDYKVEELAPVLCAHLRIRCDFKAVNQPIFNPLGIRETLQEVNVILLVLDRIL